MVCEACSIAPAAMGQLVPQQHSGYTSALLNEHCAETPCRKVQPKELAEAPGTFAADPVASQPYGASELTNTSSTSSELVSTDVPAALHVRPNSAHAVSHESPSPPLTQSSSASTCSHATERQRSSRQSADAFEQDASATSSLTTSGASVHALHGCELHKPGSPTGHDALASSKHARSAPHTVASATHSTPAHTTPAF
eukprot:CAMPEP_0185833578 /NCGR_PEP_ID=MMETSP1353-20130828/3127_1 /TAXON_ID=1077150 /ORGANISM="Erythrolobus australicus, Strain CCMP3124" /LENGTH=197 /DNA_ID=CAMNT_0028531889 /DNA_START=135 /DNA_END=725 /DNA_ORIENTATION=-